VKGRSIRRKLATRLVLAAAFAALAAAAAPSALACGAGTYTYAGMAAVDPAFGVSGVLTPLGSLISAGHVAGWVGLGGPGEGPNGTNEWIQVGLSSFPLLGANDIYYEVARPGREPSYHTVRQNVQDGAPVHVAVLEMHAHHGWWRVWVNGRPVSRAIRLPGSHDRWAPIATAESWDGGSPTCNGFLYRFDGVHLAQAPGGGWAPASHLRPIHSANTEVTAVAPASFFAAGGRDGLRLLASARR